MAQDLENKVIARDYIEQNYIHKDKIIEKLNEISNEYNKIIEDKSSDLQISNIRAFQYNSMRNVLEELLEGK